jgi:hypothetical protein
MPPLRVEARLGTTWGGSMNFVNRASSAKSEQGEEALEVEIRELARRDSGHADLVNDDAKLASNNLGVT